MKQLFIMAHDTARQNAVEAVRNAPAGYRVEIKPASRSLEQNSKVHAIITEFGNRIGWNFNGAAIDLEDLKVICMSAYRKQQREGLQFGQPLPRKSNSRFVIGIEGEPVDLNLKTSRLSKSECAELIEMIDCILVGMDEEGV